MTRRGWIGCLLMAAAVGVSCGRPYPATPGAVIQAALGAANERKFEEARQYVATEGMMLFGKKMPSPREMVTPGFWNEFTQNRRIKTVTIEHEKAIDKVAEVVAQIGYEDGRTMKAEFVLSKEKPGWMMTTVYTTSKGW
ncbi:MAG: DUF4878 domain-containing protein [Bryobacterales bacterium]|nr:DUF4878 domain-containing protein [Bryobacterales bacterium]